MSDVKNETVIANQSEQKDAEKIAEISKSWNSKGLILPVVPVPPRPGKIRQKGWDQIDELCFYLRNLYGIETLPFLRRLTRFQQKKLNRLHRLEQIKNAFVLRPQKEIQKSWLLGGGRPPPTLRCFSHCLLAKRPE